MRRSTDHSGVEEDLSATLANLGRSGFKLGLVSNTFVDGSIHDRHLDLDGLLGSIPVRVYSSEVGFASRIRRIFQWWLDRPCGRARRDVRWGPGEDEIVGARRLGMKTALKQPLGEFAVACGWRIL